MNSKQLSFSILAVSLLALAGCQPQSPVALQTPAATQQTVPQSSSDSQQIKKLEVELEKTRSDLVEAQFKLALKDFWGSDSIYRHPLDKNKFIFIIEDATGEHISLYDLRKDINYQKNGSFNIPEGLTPVYTEKHSRPNDGTDIELRGVGMDGSKLVIWETGVDNSPGPCFNPWQADDLTYIDVDVPSSARNSYTVPESKMKEVEKEVAECEKMMLQ